MDKDWKAGAVERKKKVSKATVGVISYLAPLEVTSTESVSRHV